MCSWHTLGHIALPSMHTNIVKLDRNSNAIVALISKVVVS